MAEHSPVEIVQHASTWSIVWGVLLIIFGMLAIGSPFLAAVAVNVVIAWLIVLAGVVHLIVAFHAHRAGSLIWKLLVGLAYLFFRCIPDHASSARCSIAYFSACIALPDRRHLEHRSVFQDAVSASIKLGAG